MRAVKILLTVCCLAVIPHTAARAAFKAEAKPAFLSANQQAQARAAMSKGKKGNQLAEKDNSSRLKAEGPRPKAYLIEKLNYLIQNLETNHKAVQPIKLRLAHILSLKAEENFIKAEKESCVPCEKRAISSAQKALALYEELDSSLSSRHAVLRAESLFKRAYLLKALGKRSKSLSYLEKITKEKNISPLLKARAWLGIGEARFEIYDYKKALQAFDRVLERGKSPWRLKAAYRKIWSLFNLSLNERAVDELEALLKSDSYASADLSLEDQKIKRRLEGELVSLYSYAKVTGPRLAFLHSRKQGQSALFGLAQALSRLGRMEDSNKVWEMYISKAPLPKDRLKAYFFMLDNDLNLDKTSLLEDAAPKMTKLFSLRQKANLSTDFDLSLKNKAKSFLNKAIKRKSLFSKKQKERLLALFQTYSAAYPEGAPALSRSAYLAMNLKKYGLAQDLFQKAALSLDSYRDEKISPADMREEMSVKQMEAAERSKNKKRQLNSYSFYIQRGASPDLIFKAKYQTAYMGYKSGECHKSAERFFDLALNKTGAAGPEIKDLRLKSAHLSLSCLDRLGDQEEKLAQRAGIFIKKLPTARKEFMRIYHSALLNTVKKLVADKDFSLRPAQASKDKSILKAWDILNLMIVKEANKKEALAFHLNRMIIAKELLKFDQMEESAQALLSDKNLKEEDRKIALTWKLWLAELRFDFKEVLKIVKILQPANQSEEELLQLARLAELAGQSPLPYYKIFTKKFPKSRSLKAVVVSMIKKSDHKGKKALLRKYGSLFKDEPETLSYLALEADERKGDWDFIKLLAGLDFMADSALSVFARRKEAIEFFESGLTQVSNYFLPSPLGGRRLKQELKAYAEKINRLGQSAEKSLKTDDWTIRVFIISLWKREISRFYRAIMNLPPPKGLTAEEKAKYTDLLRDRLQIHKRRIAALESELNALLSRDFIADYRQSLGQSKDLFRLLEWEMRKLSFALEGENRAKIHALLADFKNGASLPSPATAKTGKTQTLYQALRKNPFDQKSLKELLNLEKEQNNEALSYYLSQRIKELTKKSWRSAL